MHVCMYGGVSDEISVSGWAVKLSECGKVSAHNAKQSTREREFRAQQNQKLLAYEMKSCWRTIMKTVAL